MQLVCPIQTKLALLARANDPLDASPITYLPQVLHIRVHSNHFACTLMPGNAFSGIHHLHAERSPLIV
jgi:hypothetical protein